MPTTFHRKWHLLPAGRPGERFRSRYHEHQRSRRGRGLGAMVLRFVLAGVCVAIGFILVFIPGPAVVFFLIAGALLATDWLAVARLLDWGEVRARRIWTRLRGWWKKMSTPGRVALVLGAVILGAAASYGSYLLVR